MANQLLTIDTMAEPDRPVIEINGHKYQIRLVQDFGLKDEAEYRRLSKKFFNASEETKFEELAVVLDDMVRKVVIDLPEDVFAKLKENHKLAIVSAFTKEAGKSRQPAPELKDKAV